MVETDETKKNRVIGVNLASTETIGGQISLKNDAAASSIITPNESPAMQDLLKVGPDFAAQQQKLCIQEPVIKNNPALGVYELNDDLKGLQHGTYLQAANRESHTKDRSLVSRHEMKATASLVNYKEATNFSGYGHLKNETENAKSVEVVYTLPAFNNSASNGAQVIVDEARVNQFDGFEYKDEQGNVIPGFDITYSYQGHEGEYSTIDTLKRREDFGWGKVTAIMVFGSLLPHSSYRVEFPFKIVNADQVNSQTIFNLNEYAVYDLTINQHTNSRLNFRLSTPIFARSDYQDISLMAITKDNDEYQPVPTAVQQLMPTLGEVPSTITNFNAQATISQEDSNDEQVLWQGGRYFFALAPIQSAIQEHGYSVNVDETGRKLMQAAAFTVNDTHLTLDGADFIPYILIHQLLITKEFTLKAETKDDWTPAAGIVKVAGLAANNKELAVDPEQAFIVDDSALNSAQPGEYEVTIGYFLNGSEDDDMLITSSTKVAVVENKQTINVHYVDLISATGKDKEELQPSDGKVLSDQTQTFTGKGDQSYTNQLWGPDAGYEIFAFEEGAKQGKYVGGEPAKDYYVYLTHKIEKIDEDHQVTRTIIFNMPAGAKQVVKQTGRIQRFGVVDKTNDEKTWSDWSTATLPAVEAPVIPGYTSRNVATEPISLTTKDSNVEISYQPEKVSAKIKFVDEDGQQIDEQVVTGLTGELIDYSPKAEIKNLAAQGYLIVENDLPTHARFMATDDKKTPEYQIVVSRQKAQVQPVTIFYVDVPLKHLPLVKPSAGTILSDHTQKLEVAEGDSYTNQLWDYAGAGYDLFKADEGATKGQYFAGSPEQQYYVYLTHHTTPQVDKHQVTRTIKIEMPDKTQQVIVQEAVATRTGFHDEVTGKDNWQDWVNGTFPKYVPTTIAGYEAQTIAAEEVDAQATDSELAISYSAKPAEVTVKFSDQFGTELKTTNFTGVTGEEFNYDPADQIKQFENEGYQLKENNFPADHHFAAGKQTYAIKLNKLVPVKPHSANNDNEKPASTASSTSKKGIFAAFKGLF